MNPGRSERLESLLREALARAPADRAAFLDAECRGDGALRAEVDSALARYHEAESTAADSAAKATSEVLKPGFVLAGRYRIDSELGRGGMGRVYRATQLALSREVAVKVLADRISSSPVARLRFEREAAAVARLRHPHIVTVYDAGSEPGVGAFFAMELVSGRSLAAELAACGRLPVAAAVDLMRQVAEGVDAAHAAGIVHRDLKPANVMLERDGPNVSARVLDFGLAMLVEEPAAAAPAAPPAAGGADVGLTVSGIAMGTPLYMSPEQVRGERVDARSDVWSLGVMLYETLAGATPFARETAEKTFLAILGQEPEPLGARAPGAPEALVRLVESALSKDAARRLTTAREVARELGRIARAMTSETAAVTASLAAPDWSLPPTNLRDDAGPLIGREAELRALAADLMRDDVRVVTLTGPGGTGKTRLAREAARALRSEFEGGVFFVDLSALRDAALVVPTVARVLGLREAAGASPEESLVAHLGARSVLVVLDNFEQVAEAAAAVARLVDAAPRLKVLVTSRALLRISAEREFAVHPLDVPAPGRAASVGDVGRYPAVALFVERAHGARKSFALTERNADAVAAICRRLDGLPLALELAAARLKMLSPEALLARLDERLALLTTGDADLPERQRTMRAAVAWSYDLLDERERRVFRQLSVFEGGGSIDQAEGVCGGRGVDVLDAVTSLVENSLLERREPPEGEPRFGMLEVIREFARGRLEESGEAEEVERRHADTYLAFVEGAEPELRGADAAKWLDRLEAEHDNARRALETYLRDDPENALRMASALSGFWNYRGHYSEATRWFEAALERGRAAPAEALTRALYEAGTVSLQQGDLEAARKFASEVIRLAEEIGATRRVAAAHYTLGNVAVRQGDFDAARSHIEQSLAFSREVEHVRLTEHCLNSLGEIARLVGDLAAARSYYEQAEAIVRTTGDRDMLQIVLNNLAAVALGEGDLDAARAGYGEALRAARGVLGGPNVSLSLDGFAAEAAARGAWRRAGLLAGAAEALREGSGYDLEPLERSLRDRSLAAAREHLGEAACEAAVADGRALSLDEAVRMALDEIA